MSKRTIIGAHPAADVWPMLDEPDLRRLADDIKTNGLRHPIVLDRDGRIVDGRNRHAACQIAGIDPEFEVYDGDDVAAFVLSENNERRHMTLPERAAATALTLGASRRKSGRWERGSVPEDTSRSRSWGQAMAQAGMVLDHRPDLLAQVAAGTLALDAAHQEATETRKLAEQKSSLPEDLRALVESGSLDMGEALRRAELPTDYADRVADGHLSLDEAEELSKRDERDRREAVDRQLNRVRAFLSGFHAASHLAEDPLRDEVLEELNPTERDTFLRIEKEATWPTT